MAARRQDAIVGSAASTSWVSFPCIDACRLQAELVQRVLDTWDEEVLEAEHLFFSDFMGCMLTQLLWSCRGFISRW